MGVEKMQFAMTKPEAAICKAKSKVDKEKASLKAKAKAEKEAEVLKAHAEEEAAILKAKAEAEKEGAIKAKAKAAKEERIIKANCCCGSDEDDVPYGKLCHDSDSEEDPDIIMSRIVERWDLFIEEEKVRFPGLKFGDSCEREYTGDSYQREHTGDDQEDSDDEQYYHRLLDEGILV
ncbi:hypothetical protein ACQJBY_046523 [Aegilops geniculata]